MIARLAALLGIALVALGAGGGRIDVAAHRGGALLWPENSLLAFRGALGLGADWLELDVHATADGEAVVIHDATLDRTTTGQGFVASTPLADLGRLRLRGRDGTPTGEPVPTLEQVLELAAGGRAGLLLEIKLAADRARYPGLEDRVLALLRARSLLARTLVMSFDAETLRRVRDLEPAARTVLLVGRGVAGRAGPDALVRAVRDAGAGHLGIDHRALDAAVLKAARAVGLGVAAWTVNEEPAARAVIDLGVDIVISDRPDLVLGLLGRAATRP